MAAIIILYMYLPESIEETCLGKKNNSDVKKVVDTLGLKVSEK